MFLKKDIRCVICLKIFCCANCRKRHQNLEHMENIKTNRLNLDCPICNGVGAFILHKVNNIYSEKLLEHIVLEHLPMQCNKCFKTFDDRSNFYDWTSVQCKIESPSKSKSNTESPGTVLETIPEIEINNNKIMTELLQKLDPLVANKQQTRLSVDSAFSLRNVSSIMKIDQSANGSADHTKSPGQKLVRTTSTPMHETYPIELTSKHTPDSSSGGHVMMISSINQQTPGIHSCSGSESDSSHNPNSSSSFIMKKPNVPKLPRNKILMAATPLQQVMSKSIQRAIREHGLKSFNEMRENSSRSHSDSSIPSPRVGPLDLRTTPVIRRSELQYDQIKYQSIENSQQLRIVQRISTIERSSNIKTISSTNLSTESTSVYETCRSVTSIVNNIDTLMTPKNAQNQGVILKKAISFTSGCENTPIAEKPRSLNDSDSDVWFTPSTVLTRSQSCSILDHARNQIDQDDDVFVEETNRPLKKKSGLWSLVTKTVMRLKSLGSTTASLTNHNNDVKKDIPLSNYHNHSEISNEPPYIKRRKISQNSHNYSILSNDLRQTNQIMDQQHRTSNNMESAAIELNEPRRRKIHCRPAISRMRK